jgi:peptidoglycan/LPS O-acetylase OafA/YrhL
MVTTPAVRTAGRRAVPADRSPSRLRTLDLLRFAGAIGVLLYHFTSRWSTVWGRQPGDVFPVLGHVSTYFALAPEMFFVLSGFVILWTAWGRSVPQVLASRLARVFPTYWAALALTSVLLLVVWPEGKRISPGEVAVNATLLQEPLGVRHVDGVYWTLWAELRFYLLVAVLVGIGLTRRRVLAFAAAWPVAAEVAQRAGWEQAREVLVAPYAPFFAGGMALFLVWRHGHSWRAWGVVALCAALGVQGAGWATVATLDQVTVFRVSPVLVVLATLACFGLVAAATLTPLARLDRPWMSRLGELTYPVYLVHLFWGWWVISLLAPVLSPGLTLAVALAVVLALALLVLHGVERRAHGPVRRALERHLTEIARLLTPPGRDRRQPSPPTVEPGVSVPVATEVQKAGVWAGSSWTVEPTPPGR